MRKFEKISFEQFSKDIKDDINLYNEYSIPRRETLQAAGYDFFAIYDYVVKPGEIMMIPTGIKVLMEDDDALILCDRSSMGFKYNVRFVNQVGIIDADYYYNGKNDGHMWIKIQNEGTEDYIVKKGDKMCQGIFVKYLLTDDDNETNFIKRVTDL